MRTGSIYLTSVFVCLLTATGMTSEKFFLDKAHTRIGFSVKHLVISNTIGKFNDFRGTIVFDEKDTTQSSVKITITVSSIDTDNERRDTHLTSDDFFDAENHPEITFVSKKIKQRDGGYVAVGDLTIREVTKEVELPFIITGRVEGPQGHERIGFEASMSLNRFDYGLKWDKTIEAGGLIVGEEVKISISGEGIESDEDENPY